MPFREHCKVRAEWWIKINIDQSRAVAHPNIKRTLPMVTAEAPVLLDLDLLPKRLGGGRLIPPLAVRGDGSLAPAAPVRRIAQKQRLRYALASG